MSLHPFRPLPFFLLSCLAMIGLAADPAQTREVDPERAVLHYQPEGGIFGDPIPFYHDGTYHVFYLHRLLNPEGGWSSDMTWHHLVSKDLVHWEDLGPAIETGPDERMIATGSIVEQEGVFHAFYTTASRSRGGTGLAEVRVATSTDLMTWRKESGEPLLLLRRDVPGVGTYEAYQNWRDPHVFWNPDAGEWWLAIAAHERTDLAYPYAGAVAYATSPDLRNWTVQPQPLLASREIVASECPDVFPFGDGWAMAYYTNTTRIRIADTPGGPWRRPVNDVPWGLHYHAGKQAFDGQRNIFFAYIPRLGEAEDYAPHVYGGCMALPRELYLDDAGAVATRLPKEIVEAFSEDATGGRGAQVLKAGSPDSVATSQSSIRLAAETGAAALAVWEKAPANYYLSADVTLAPGATLRLLLRGRAAERHWGRAHPNPLDDSYALTLDDKRNSVTLLRQNAWNRMPYLRNHVMDFPRDRSFRLQVILNGDVLEAFVDDRISLSARVLNSEGALGLLVRDGRVQLDNLRISRLP